MRTFVDRGSRSCRLTPALNVSDHRRVLLVSFISPVPLFKGCVWLCNWKRKIKKRIIKVGRRPWDWNHEGEFRPDLPWRLHTAMGAALLYCRCGGPENVGERIQLEQYLKPWTFTLLRTTEIKKRLGIIKKGYIESAKIFKCQKKNENVISTREIMHVFFSFLKSGSFFCHVSRL